MAQTLAPLTAAAPLAAMILMAGCFKASDDDDDIGGATEESASDSTESAGDSTEESTSTNTTSTDTTEDTSTGPECGPTETVCGPDCADLDTDPNHCGMCDHSCVGGECTDGVCGVVDLASGKGRLFMVLVDADYVYYGGDGVDVGRIDKDGANDTILKIAGMDNADREWCYQSAITSNSIVWGNDWVQPGVRGCITPACAGGVQTFVGGLNMVAMTYAKGSDTLYWNQASDIMARAWPGGMPSLLISSNGVPRSLATDPNYVYWSSNVAASDYRLNRVPVAAGMPIELVGSRPTMGDIEVGPSFVYWAENAEIYKVPIDGGAVEPFGTSPTDVRFFAVDAKHLYWTSGGDAGAVLRCPIEGCAGQPELLAPAVTPWGITHDPAAVYWVTEAGTIHKLAK